MLLLLMCVCTRVSVRMCVMASRKMRSDHHITRVAECRECAYSSNNIALCLICTTHTVSGVFVAGRWLVARTGIMKMRIQHIKTRKLCNA